MTNKVMNSVALQNCAALLKELAVLEDCLGTLMKSKVIDILLYNQLTVLVQFFDLNML